MNISKLLPSLAAFIVAFTTTMQAAPMKVTEVYRPLAFENVKVGGELRERLMRNFNRLEETKYQPDNVFLTLEQSDYWPGDTEGRTILGLVMDARATGRTPLYLDEILRRLPQHLNKSGYMGLVCNDSVDEQQLSGNGWMLRGLCEYYLWKHDPATIAMLSRLARSLYLPGRQYYSYYPLSPDERVKNIGEATGRIGQRIGHWLLSTDIGCVFIGMEGLLQAYQLTKDEELGEACRELIDLFLKVDLTGIKAQTHASLTAMRGLIRYADITGEDKYVEEAAKRWQTYKRYGMTELYDNYNWFCRYDTWTEPCAIIDAFMVAMQLWHHTGKAEYRNDAEMIYYNALCIAQRSNGGFGLENCPGKATGKDAVAVKADEAHWCCTMRGGEGLGRAAQYTAAEAKDELAIAFMRPATISTGTMTIEVATDYPFDSSAKIKVVSAPGKKFTIGIAKAPWMENYSVAVNGKNKKYTEANGLARITRRFKAGDVIMVKFDMKPRFTGTVNQQNTSAGDFRVLYGPFVLGGAVGNEGNVVYGEKFASEGRATFRGMKSGTVLSPVYHLMSPAVRLGVKPAWSRRILFSR